MAGTGISRTQAYYSLIDREFEWELMPPGDWIRKWERSSGARCPPGRLGGKYRRGHPHPVRQTACSRVGDMALRVKEDLLFNIVDVPG